MEPTPRVRAVRDAWVDAFNSRDKDRFLALHAESAVFHDPTFPAPIHGRKDLGTWFEGLFKMFPDCRMDAVRAYGLEDWVTLEAVETGTMKGPIRHPKGEVPPTGKSFKINTVVVCRVEDGSITEVRSFYDVFDLMSQLGLQA